MHNGAMKKRDIWKERHDRERAAHAANLKEWQKCEAKLEKLQIAGREILNQFAPASTGQAYALRILREALP